MSSEEKLEQSEIAKSKGTDYFKKENYKQAKKLYKKVITFLENETDLEEEKKKKRNNLMLAAHLNIALCEIKMANYSEAKQHCNKALEIDPNNVKAFFRRGTCFFNVNDYEPALDDYNKVLQIEPDNEAARNHAFNCHQLQQFKEKDKLIYDRMFSRFTAQDPCDLTLKTAKQLINRSKEPIPVLVQTQTLKDLLPLRSTKHMSCLRDDQVWVSDNYGNLVLFDSKGSKLDKLEVDIFADDGFHTVTDDGELIFTDETNKLINKVSVDKKIQVIIRTDKWTPESVFCSPVTGKLIVGLRREEYRFTKEGKAKVEIYSRTYNLLRIIKTDEEGNDLYREL